MDPENSPYLLLFRDPGPNAYKQLSPDERQQLMQQWNEWYDSLARGGQLQHGYPLDSGGRVVAGRNGERITDGPFAESTEAIGGYFLLTVANLDEATAIARRCPSLRLGMQVEVRPIVGECTKLGVRGRPH